MVAPRSVAVVTLGCARNEVDSEELAGRLAAAGWELVDDAENADVAVVNTCGFVEQAKKDSIDVLMEAAELKDGPARTQAVVAVGCLAERYGEQLAESLPEADAVLGFDSYADLSKHLDAILHGEKPKSHVPVDRRTLLPLTPTARREAAVAVPGHSQDPVIIGDLPSGVAPVSGPRVIRARLDGRPWAPLKLASGCDRRCTFCAIPAFRGAFLSRRPAEVLTEARWLAERGVKELFLVSENSTSYGKDLGDIRLLETMLPELAAVEGVDRVRVSYLQPAELRPGLIDAIAGTEGVAPYFDLSFQHSSNAVLRRMRRFGSTGDFLNLLRGIRERSAEAGIRSNVIVGFPGETEADVEELAGFLVEARLDVVGVFGYSDEDGTEAATLDGKLSADEVAARVAHITGLVEELTAQRAEDRIGERVRVLVEGVDEDDPGTMVGRAAHQGPEVDGQVLLPGVQAAPGDWVEAVVTETMGVDLIASAVDPAVDLAAPAGSSAVNSAG
ncbi:30S ribosomal protein S12 methylthiotransferase RimO [Kineosporia rhizophila]|uniref:30S ribosomal protein S12 methylthiotransferase RimO n=1 Tax=Kineosporia TaxID=49184 RepID=UPI001E45FA34|nr:30S ribosomal protein S12 methylthiotransferase RimO [Kineosporia sp. NBRC 101677]MCE0540268.1 30S ribosomal protein S12 methylthiotransferase RimO [Kineosporia rhizophila]